MKITNQLILTVTIFAYVPLFAAPKCVKVFPNILDQDVVIESEGLGRKLQLAGWWINRQLGIEVPFEGVALEDLLAITPRFLRYRPLSSVHASIERQAELKQMAEQMTASDVEDILNYLKQEVLFERTNYSTEANLKNRFKNGYPAGNNGYRFFGAFELVKNRDESLMLLSSYDLIHQTEFAMEGFLLVIKNFRVEYELREEYFSGNWIFRLAALKVFRSTRLNAIKDFFEALAHSKSLGAYGTLSFNNSKLGEFFRNASRKGFDAPELKHIEYVVKHLMMFKVWLAHSGHGNDKVVEHLTAAIEIGRSAMQYLTPRRNEPNQREKFRIHQEIDNSITLIENDIALYQQPITTANPESLRPWPNSMMLTNLSRALGTPLPIFE